MSDVIAATRPPNRLLQLLPEGVYHCLRPDIIPTRLERGHRFAATGEALARVYFPIDCLIALQVVLEDGQSAEIATLGRQDRLGLPLLFGADLVLFGPAVVVPGMALSIGAAAFRDQVERSADLRALLGRYTLALFFQVSQLSACNALHDVRKRVACWLLRAADGVGSDRFPLTHETLGHALGVRRASVTEAAHQIAAAGLIRHRPGTVAILDRPGLEGASCACYREIRAVYDRLLAGCLPGVVSEPDVHAIGRPLADLARSRGGTSIRAGSLSRPSPRGDG